MGQVLEHALLKQGTHKHFLLLLMLMQLRLHEKVLLSLLSLLHKQWLVLLDPLWRLRVSHRSHWGSERGGVQNRRGRKMTTSVCRRVAGHPSGRRGLLVRLLDVSLGQGVCARKRSLVCQLKFRVWTRADGPLRAARHLQKRS